MKNPLRKRLPRELKGELGKYLVVFILMVLTIGMVSGFLVADGSMIVAYNDGFDKYNIENGNFRTNQQIYKSQKEEIQNLGIKLYENFYIEELLDNGSTMRFFKNRTEINGVCLMQGEFPKATGEIAIDRMYADNNELKVGDTLKSQSGKQTWKITGLVAMSDYSCLFQNNNDSMFDSVKFGVSVVTPEEFDTLDQDKLQYNYSWIYDKQPKTEKEENIMKILITGANGQIVIMAFVFGITISNTIRRESGVIGTLRASGYTRRELIRHYMALPVLVTLVGALVGNILGYTVFKNVCAGMYYGSYSLPTYVTVWSAEAFLLTTVVPVIIMLVVNYGVLRHKLRLSPLKFLRRDLSGRKKKKAIYLSPVIKIFSRFRLRVIFQNMSNYLVLFIGIIFANLLLMFGLLLPSALSHYQVEIQNNMLAKYQYMLQVPVSAVGGNKFDSLFSILEFYMSAETKNEDAEEFSAYSLNTLPGKYKSEEVLLYGIEPDSRYVKADLDKGIYISSAYADKYGIHPGDTITLKEKYEKEQYSFKVTGIYDYTAGLCVFMTRTQLNETFDLGEDYYSGYFSDTRITDIKDKYIGSVVDLDALTKISRQLDVSMGSMMGMVNGFAIVIYMVLIYLLSKIIIEKNAQSISMVKILGYTNGEISRLYILSTSMVVVLCLLVSLPIETAVMKVLFREMMLSSISGWITLWIDPMIYVQMFAAGIITYGIVALLEFRRVKKVPMDEALKNVE